MESRIAKALNSETGGQRLAGQISRGHFEQACADFLAATFTRLQHLRPGDWTIRKVGGRGPAAGVAHYEQYAHLVELTLAVEANPSLRTVLGNGYAIAPDVIVSRAPVTDDEINKSEWLVDDGVATRAALRASVQPQQILHAVISCKWTLRSDRRRTPAARRSTLSATAKAGSRTSLSSQAGPHPRASPRSPRAPVTSTASTTSPCPNSSTPSTPTAAATLPSCSTP